MYVQAGMCNSVGGKIKTEIVNTCFQGINLTINRAHTFSFKELKMELKWPVLNFFLLSLLMLPSKTF